MTRNKKEQPNNFYKAFPVAMRKLIEENGVTRQALADHLGKTRQAISYYCDGSSSPDWETIVKIADYFDVSTDYLLGRTKDPSRQPCAADEMGFSEKAIKLIREHANPPIMDGINIFLEGFLVPPSGYRNFFKQIKEFCDAVQCVSEGTNTQHLTAEDFPEDIRKKFGNAMGKGNKRSQDLITSFMLQSELVKLHPQLKNMIAGVVVKYDSYVLEEKLEAINSNFKLSLAIATGYKAYLEKHFNEEE